MGSVTAVLMIGPSGPGPRAQLLSGARWAAAADALAALRRIPDIGQVIIACPASLPGQHPPLPGPEPEWDFDPPDGDFHFGARLTGLIERHRIQRLCYLGAGSVPLLAISELAGAAARIAAAPGRLAITNNLHSADWALFTEAQAVGSIAHWLQRDNMLAWRLRESAGYQVEALPPSAASRVDIDTPVDLQLLALHPHTQPRLRAWLANQPARLRPARLQQAADSLRTPGNRVTLIGRAPAAACLQLEAARLWTRVFSEERGMVASRRQAEGRVYSLVAEHIERVGAQAFMARLAQVSDLVLFDTRVFLAHHGLWPSEEERFAADMGESAAVSDAGLRALVAAAGAAPVPVVLGGHNVVSGGVFALLEIARLPAVHQP